MIRAENITKYYNVQGSKKIIFENLSIELPPGERLALVGPNGAGKSTLLRVLCGVEKPNAGKVIRTSSVSWPVGLKSGAIATLTGKENVQFVCRLFSCSDEEMREKIAFVEEFADIGSYFHMPISSYSSGMTSRLGFGMSVAFEFDYYIVDETLAAGDATFKDKARRVFEERAKGKGMVLVSHSMSDIEHFCTKGLFFHDGQYRYSEDIRDIIYMYRIYCQKKLKGVEFTD